MNINDIDEFNCSICLEVFGNDDKTPRFLLCGHSFCQSCLTNVLARNPSCPTCKRTIQFPSIESIPINYAIKSLVDRIKNKDPFGKNSIGEKLSGQDSQPQKQILLEDSSVRNGCPRHPNQQLNIQCLTCDILICQTCNDEIHCSCEKLPIKEVSRQLQSTCYHKLTKAIDQIDVEKSNLKLRGVVLDKINSCLTKEITEKKNEKEKINTFIETTKGERTRAKFIESELGSFKTIVANPTTVHNYFEMENIESKLNLFLSTASQHNSLMANQCIYVYIKTIKDTKTWFQGKTSQENVRYGKVEIEHGRLKICSFQSNKPKENSSNLLVNFREFLYIITGSQVLPTKAFLEISSEDENLGQIIISAEELTPRSLNFLVLVSGLKRACYKGTKLNNSYKCAIQGGDYSHSSSSVSPSVVEGIENGGIYKARLKRGYVFGYNVEALKDSLFVIYHTDFPEKIFGNKFAKVDNGMHVIDNVKEKLRNDQHANIFIKECGFIL